MSQSHLREAASLHAFFTPGKSLDSAATSRSGVGDTILTSEATHSIGAAPLAEAVASWERLTASEDTLVRQLAERSLREIELTLYAYDQVTGTADMSQEIAAVQEQLHGHFNAGLYKAALGRRIHILGGLKLNDTALRERRSALIRELKEVFDTAAVEEVEIVEPTERTLSQVGAWLQDQYEDIIDEIDALDGNTLDAETMKRIFNLAIDTTPVLRTNNWDVTVIDRQKTAVSVYSAESNIVIPRTRTATKDELKRLTVHEVLGHALRSANATRFGSDIGAIGTPTYGQFEESFMIAQEQCFSQKYQSFRGVDHYIAVGLAVTSGRSIDEIASFFYDLYYFNALRKPEITDATGAAERAATKQIQRTFAGMTDVDSGIANRKDINYLHGLNGAWKLLNYMTEHNLVDSGMRWLMAAKFNPFDVADRAMVEKFHPMPEELTRFFATVTS